MKHLHLKVLLLIQGLLLSGFDLCAQQENPWQTIVNMVMADKCFEARDYMETHKDAIQQSEETLALYKFKMYGFMNQPDSSIYYLEKILKEYPSIYKGKGSPEEVFFTNALLELYYGNGDYEKSLAIYTSIEKGLQSSLLQGNKESKNALEAVQKAKLSLAKWMKVPKTKVVNLSDNKTVTIPMTKQKPLTCITAKYKGNEMHTWIDTGSSYPLFMSWNTAEKYHLPMIDTGTDSIVVNGKKVRAGIALVDSLRFGDLLITNLPACVTEGDDPSLLPDSIANDTAFIARNDSLFGFSDILLGLPMLKMLGSMELDWNKGEINLQVKSDVLPVNEKPNIFVTPLALYTHLWVNGNSLAGLLDSGARHICVSMPPSFYHLHAADIQLASEKSTRMIGFARCDLDVRYNEVQNPQVLLDGRNLHLNEEDVWVWKDELEPLYKDGFIGFPFLKKIGNKVKFDFVNMRLTAE